MVSFDSSKIGYYYRVRWWPYDIISNLSLMMGQGCLHLILAYIVMYLLFALEEAVGKAPVWQLL